jgi:hypothetical protein
MSCSGLDGADCDQDVPDKEKMRIAVVMILERKIGIFFQSIEKIGIFLLN